MSRVVRFFDKYTKSLGWEIIPTLPKSKIPFMKGWQDEYDWDRIRRYLVAHPECNIGLRLGHVIDVEADSPEANARLDRLLAGAPDHPSYRSAKSTHHLFLTPDPDLTKIVAQGIEFRGGRHQSLLPPSVTKDGVEYTWLTWKTPIPPLPEQLLNLYNRHAKIVRGARSGCLAQPLCRKCNKQSRPIHVRRYERELAAFKRMGIGWHCHRCRDRDMVRVLNPLCRKMKYAGLSTR